MNKFQDVYKCTVKNIDGAKHFFVTFIDINCHTQTIEVDEHVYDEFQQFKRIDKRQQHHFERHIEHNALSDKDLHNRSSLDQELTDDVVIKKIYNEIIAQAVESLSDVQRRRVVLYFEYDLSHEKIAEIENCSKASVTRSLRRAKDKISMFLKKYYK